MEKIINNGFKKGRFYMKQQIISYLSTIKDKINILSKYLNDNPEPEFKEYKSCKYISNFLTENGFHVKENFLNVPEAFYCEKGEGNTAVCFLCQYASDAEHGNICGSNIESAASIAAFLAVSQVIPKVKGKAVLIGCPGGKSNNFEYTLIKSGIFSKISAVFKIIPYTEDALSGTSKAVIPVKVTIKGDSEYKVSNAYYFIVNSLNFIKNSLKNDNISFTDTSSKEIIGKNDFYIISKFYVKADMMSSAIKFTDKIKVLNNILPALMEVNCEISSFGTPAQQFCPSSTLSRLLSHNFKESGIINIKESINLNYASNIGSISHVVPSICPFVSVTEDKSIKYCSKEYGKATLSAFAQDRTLKATQALAFTALDLIEKPELLIEARKEMDASHPELKVF